MTAKQLYISHKLNTVTMVNSNCTNLESIPRTCQGKSSNYSINKGLHNKIIKNSETQTADLPSPLKTVKYNKKAYF
jgi:hypothetical protein